MNAQQIREFILAGNALFTIKSMRTGEHYTFKVVQELRRLMPHHHGDPTQPCREPECAEPIKTWKVKVLSGRDNARDYRYIGSIRKDKQFYGTLHHTDAFLGFAWVWNHLDKVGERFEFHHCGRCGRCGRLLTTPESVSAGIGPECRDKIDFEAMGGAQGLLDKLFGG